MKDFMFAGLVALIVFAPVACQDSPAGPSPTLAAPAKAMPTGPGTGLAGSNAEAKTAVDDLVGTWRAVKAEGINFWDPSIRRDLVAEGGKVTLVLESSPTPKDYSVTLVMPGEAPRGSYGFWHRHEYWGQPQLDFYPGWIPLEQLEYGHGMGFLYTLSGDTLTLTDGGSRFLGYDFGWHDSNGHDGAKLELVLIRN
jgi:hypothetical protein